MTKPTDAAGTASFEQEIQQLTDTLADVADGDDASQKILPHLCMLPWRTYSTPQLLALADLLFPLRDDLAELFPCLSEFWFDGEFEGAPAEFYEQLHKHRPETDAQDEILDMSAFLDVDSLAGLPMAAADPVTEYANVALWSGSAGYRIPPAKVRVVSTPRIEAAPATGNPMLRLCASFEWENKMPEPMTVTGIFVVEYGADPQNRKVVYLVRQENVNDGASFDYQIDFQQFEGSRIKGYYLCVAPPNVEIDDLTLHPGKA